MAGIRVATWNIDRSGIRAQWRAIEQARVLEELHADVYVVTEAHDDFQLSGRRAAHLSAPGLPPYQPKDRAAGIWTSWPLLRAIATRDARLTACAEFDSPLGAVLVYATVLPYRDDGKPGGAKPWERHRQAVADQSADWQDLQREFPNHHLIIAGDFNMTMGGSDAYVDRESRARLQANCKPLRLQVITDVDLRPIIQRSNIDHVVVSEGLQLEGPVEAWSGTVGNQQDKTSLSDHNGVAVNLVASVQTRREEQ